MTKITKIFPKKKGRYSIFLDNKQTLDVSEDIVIKFGILEGQEIDGKKLKEIEKTEAESAIYFKALRLISYRLRSEKELFDRLSKKFKKEMVKKVINRLKKEGLLNDREFARAFIETRKRLKPKGKRLLFWELKQKGIDEEVIKEFLEKEYNKGEELLSVMGLINKKVKTYKNLPKEKRAQRLIQFLLRRGFDWDVIQEAIKNTNIKINLEGQ